MLSSENLITKNRLRENSKVRGVIITFLKLFFQQKKRKKKNFFAIDFISANTINVVSNMIVSFSWFN